MNIFLVHHQQRECSSCIIWSTHIPWWEKFPGFESWPFSICLW